LKSLRKPITLWPVIVAFARPFRTVTRMAPDEYSSLLN